MLVSVIVRTKDEAPRLRLVLASLSRQTVRCADRGTVVPPDEAAFETIVVNDGSSDHTPAVLEAARESLPVFAVHHSEARGRSAASNAGAAQATGEVLLFLDGDTLAAPDLVALHARKHVNGPRMARGEVYHLRCTRFLLDPETGVPQPGHEERVARLGPDLARSLVTRQQVLEHFEAIATRAELGVYPGSGPRRLAELEMDALQRDPNLSVLWMAASGSNCSVPRADFSAAGGFDARLDVNEHRELAFRLAERGVRMELAAGARSYHLTHRSGWRDPLLDVRWERYFYDAHPCLAVKLMAVFWMSIGGVKIVSEEARITSLAQLDAIVRHGTTIDYDAIRRAHPALADLSAAAAGRASP